MREYGQIQCSFWQKASEEGWSSDATLLGAYLLTGPHSNGIGCYRLPDGYISDDLGWVPERVSETIQELLLNGFCKRFGTVVLVPKFLRWNPISNGNVAKARKHEFEVIPNEEAKSAAALSLLEFGNHWEKGFMERLKTLSKGFGKQDPTQPNPEPTLEDAAAASPPPSHDPVKQLFDAGVKLLTDSGCETTKARTMLGKFRKEHGDARVMAALVLAKSTRPSSPLEWLVKTIPTMSGQPTIQDSSPLYVSPASDFGHGWGPQ